MKMRNAHKGFSLIEILVVIAIIGIIASIILAALNTVRKKGRDAKRKYEISQIGRFLSGSSCYIPNAGAGDYDIMGLADEIRQKYPQYASTLSVIPRDPRVGNDIESFYHYILSTDGKKCALYANLEFEDERVTLMEISIPTAGGGTGVFEATTDGWNNSPKYFQVSN